MRVPHKLAQRIWKGEFIDRAELLPEKLGQSEDTANTKAARGGGDQEEEAKKGQ